MNKTELRDLVSEEAGITKKEASIAVDGVISCITKGLKEDGKVTLVGFGTFHVAKQGARVARNPKTGDAIDVPEKMVPKFRASSALKDLIKETA